MYIAKLITELRFPFKLLWTNRAMTEAIEFEQVDLSGTMFIDFLDTKNSISFTLVCALILTIFTQRTLTLPLITLSQSERRTMFAK